MSDESVLSSEEQRKIDEEINQKSEDFLFNVFDFTLRDLMAKFSKERLSVPRYQRRFVWSEKKQRYFIESLFLNLPIPSIFLGRTRQRNYYEIIDGVQRLSSIRNFVDGNLKLEGLKKITSLNGRTFKQLSENTQDDFLERTLRTIVLSKKLEEASIEELFERLNTELFRRLNTTGEQLSPFETIRGVFKGGLMDLIEEFESDEKFVAATPLSKQKAEKYRGDRGYFLLRFFVFLDNYSEVGPRPFEYLNKFMDERAPMLTTEDIERYRKTLNNVLDFVGQYFGSNGFGKSKNQTTRTQFDALSVGVALALRENPKLRCSSEAIRELRASKEFKELTPSGASSNSGKLSKRIEFVRDKLLEVSRDINRSTVL